MKVTFIQRCDMRSPFQAAGRMSSSYRKGEIFESGNYILELEDGRTGGIAVIQSSTDLNPGVMPTRVRFQIQGDWA